MSKKNNEEKLKILQERLAEIQQNQESKVENTNQESIRKKSKSKTKKNLDKNNKVNKKSGGALKIILIILGSLIILGGVIIGIMTISAWMNSEPSNNGKNKVIIYHKKQWNEDHSHLIILNTYDTSEIKFAEIEKQNYNDKFADLNIECGLFFLPDMTNKKDSLVYQTYLGPFFSAKEAEQYYQLINPKKEISDTQMGDFKPIKLGKIITLK